MSLGKNFKIKINIYEVHLIFKRNDAGKIVGDFNFLEKELSSFTDYFI